ncbi:S1 RNA-binding domain-containing protein [Halomonas shantousis]
MVLIGRFNTLRVTKHTEFGLYLDGAEYGNILLPKRYIPRDRPSEVNDELDVFVYLDSDDRVIATTQRPRVQVGEFASLKVVARNDVGVFLDWGLPKDILLPHSEEKRPLKVGDFCVVHVYLDKRTHRITATMRLDRHLDPAPPRYHAGQAVELLITGPSDLGFNAIIDHRHRGLIHKNEAFKPLRSGMRERGFIKQVRADGKIDLSLQPVGELASTDLNERILTELRTHDGVLFISDKSPPPLISKTFGVSKATFKKALGGLYKQGQIVIHPDRIELSR